MRNGAILSLITFCDEILQIAYFKLNISMISGKRRVCINPTLTNFFLSIFTVKGQLMLSGIDKKLNIKRLSGIIIIYLHNPWRHSCSIVSITAYKSVHYVVNMVKLKLTSRGL